MMTNTQALALRKRRPKLLDSMNKKQTIYETAKKKWDEANAINEVHKGHAIHIDSDMNYIEAHDISSRRRVVAKKNYYDGLWDINTTHEKGPHTLNTWHHDDNKLREMIKEYVAFGTPMFETGSVI